MKRLKFLTAILTLGSLLFSASAMATPLVFGVHPFKKPSALHKMFRPITQELSKQLNREVKIVVGKNYSDVIKMYVDGKIDFGYMGPATYVSATQESLLVEPLVRILVKGKNNFQGVIIVKKDSALQTVDDLKGKRFSFGDRESTLSHYAPHHMMMVKGIKLADLGKYAFTGSHDNVCKSVLAGAFDAGGVKPSVAKKYMDKGLRILAKSDPVPNHVFAVSSTLDSELKKAIQTALLNMDPTILKSIKGSITGAEIPQHADYEPLRKLMAEVDTDAPK